MNKNSTTPNPSTGFVTLKEAATTTRGSKKWLRNEIKRGHLPAFRIGHRILIQQHDLDAFIANRAMAPTTEEGR